ncbi:helix-turn-helix transcriptional regulator [Herbaspirillum chlorophenolicum]|uniref:Helix-turn-helix transcriptional regulator n=1 Tax=Herbaspirillum chlorophenolicum TaxID=211589 RepID=A0ABW8EU98_9BURK
MKTANQERQFDHLVGLIYESVHNVGQLVPAMELMCDELGAIAGHYLHMDMSSREVFSSVISDPAFNAADAEYRTYYNSVDERLPWVATGAVGEWRADYERFDEGFVRRSEIYNDFLFKYGARHMVLGRIGGEASENEILSFLRPVGAEQYDADDLQFLTRITGHMIRSSMLRRRLRALESQQQADQTLLQYFPYGTVWVDAACRVVSFNNVAADMLAGADGICVKAQRLRMADPGADCMLATAIGQATGAEGRRGQWFAARRERDGQPLVVSVIPAQPDRQTELANSGGPLALVILQDMSRQHLPRSAILRKMFGLTPAEARLAEALLDNETIESYAQKASVSRNTVRTHMASLFSKTGTRRQAELLRILMMAEPPIHV